MVRYAFVPVPLPVKRVSEILASVYRQNRGPEEADQDLALCYWRDAVGGRLAQVSRPAHLAGSLLVVEVDSPEWIGALEAVRPRIQAKLNTAIGAQTVGWIVFRVNAELRKPPAKAAAADPAADGIRDPQRRRVYLASRRAAER